MSEPFVFIDIAVSALPGKHAHDACRRCNGAYGYLGRYLKADGSTGIRWVCENCEKCDTAGDLPRSLLGDVPLESLPIAKDNTHNAPMLPDCPRCGMPGTEYHHWAPRSIFPDWPDMGVFLCTLCHREWHDRMRAHGLRWPHELTVTVVQHENVRP